MRLDHRVSLQIGFGDWEMELLNVNAIEFVPKANGVVVTPRTNG